MHAVTPFSNSANCLQACLSNVLIEVMFLATENQLSVMNCFIMICIHIIIISVIIIIIINYYYYYYYY